MDLEVDPPFFSKELWRYKLSDGASSTQQLSIDFDNGNTLQPGSGARRTLSLVS